MTLPYVVIHNAVSIDSRLDLANVDVELYYQLISHWNEDLTLAGSRTILMAPDEIPPEDDSAFEPPVKDPADRRPLLAVVDSRGAVRVWHYLRKQPYWRSMMALCSKSTPKEYLDYLEKRHIDYIIAGDDRVDLRAALEELHQSYGVRRIRVDSGGMLNGILLREGLVDEVSLLVHPQLVGGTSPRSFFRAPDLTSPEGVIAARLESVETLQGGIVWLRYRVDKRG